MTKTELMTNDEVGPTTVFSSFVLRHFFGFRPFVSFPSLGTKENTPSSALRHAVCGNNMQYKVARGD
jgi:hypothetical protein